MTLPDFIAWSGAAVTLLAYAVAFRSVLSASHPTDAGLSAPLAA